MSHDGHLPEAPTSAAGDSIILHVPSCVQRFSSRRRILSRLRALAGRRSRSLPEPEPIPVKLHVEENPNWPGAPVMSLSGLAVEGEQPEVEPSLLFGGEAELESEPNALTAADAAGITSQGPSLQEPGEDPNEAIIQQLVEDNRDLKAALCRLIRISEQNEAALRLLEEENEELSTLLHRLTIGEAKAVPAAAARRRGWMRLWLSGWSAKWRLRPVRRCS